MAKIGAYYDASEYLPVPGTAVVAVELVDDGDTTFGYPVVAWLETDAQWHTREKRDQPMQVVRWGPLPSSFEDRLQGILMIDQKTGLLVNSAGEVVSDA